MIRSFSVHAKKAIFAVSWVLRHDAAPRSTNVAPARALASGDPPGTAGAETSPLPAACRWACVISARSAARASNAGQHKTRVHHGKARVCHSLTATHAAVGRIGVENERGQSTPRLEAVEVPQPLALGSGGGRRLGSERARRRAGLDVHRPCSINIRIRTAQQIIGNVG
eukprot:COSAG01_NODE_4691_length_4808_cov_14.664897_3_plen_169_part_00